MGVHPAFCVIFFFFADLFMSDDDTWSFFHLFCCCALRELKWERESKNTMRFHAQSSLSVCPAHPEFRIVCFVLFCFG
ncbi:hypothetical protein BKA57DRAFT_454945 [Linnemannia elongata]|nr:hypothetical protein BKA57DRAFT_454945 [Linnemannia elongata]